MIRRALSYVGLLAFVAFVAATQGCAELPKPADVRKAADKVERAVADARNASESACEPSIKACAVYFDAVEAGLIKPDDRAELACASVSTACELVSK